MNAAKRLAIFERFQAADPEPKTELEHASPFQLLIAVMLSAQATDRGVNKATRTLFQEVSSPADIARLGLSRVTRAVQSINFFRTKARNIVAASKILVDQFQGLVPHDRAALESLPGVGRKTANVVLNVAFGEPTVAVDTHIFRVANRTGLAPGKTPREVEDALLKYVPQRFLLYAHHWLILHGRYVCVARTPKCPQCLIADLCEYKHKTKPAAKAPRSLRTKKS